MHLPVLKKAPRAVLKGSLAACPLNITTAKCPTDGVHYPKHMEQIRVIKGTLFACFDSDSADTVPSVLKVIAATRRACPLSGGGASGLGLRATRVSSCHWHARRGPTELITAQRPAPPAAASPSTGRRSRTTTGSQGPATAASGAGRQHRKPSDASRNCSGVREPQAGERDERRAPAALSAHTRRRAPASRTSPRRRARTRGGSWA
jgi:hypothetical protein